MTLLDRPYMTFC